MRTLYKTLYYPHRKDTFKVYYLTDWHVGAKSFDETLFRQHVQQIKDDPSAYWIGGGDYIDAISHVGG